MNLNPKVEKFLAFEWLMFSILGLFWAAAMFLPLFLTQSFENPSEVGKNFVIMAGPYLVYVIVRGGFLLYSSLRWAYLTSNFFFSSDLERKLAAEWIKFVLFFLLWSALMLVPMHLTGAFDDRGAALRNFLIFAGPYILYLFSKLFVWLMRTVKWSVKVTTDTQAL